jgi:vacuolar-type H+-ATPase subunit I/STV1
MQLKEFDIILDISTKDVKYKDAFSGKVINEIIVIKDDYNSTRLNIHLESGGKSYEIGTNNAEIVFAKHDKTIIVMDNTSEGFSIEDNIIKAILSTNITSIPGRQVKGEVIVRGVNGEILTSNANFYFRVQKGLLTDEVIKSTNEIPLLNKLIKQVNDLDILLAQNESDRELVFSQKLLEINNTYNELLSKIETLDIKINDVNDLITSVNQTLTDMINSYNIKIAEVDNTKESLITTINNKINQINQLISDIELAEQERDKYKIYVGDIEPTTYMFWYDPTDN